MSAGKNFLRVIIDSRETQYFRRATEDLFIEGEVEAYRAIRGHLDAYGALPTLQELLDGQHELPEPRRASSAQYYLDQLKKRYAYSQVNQRHPQLVEAMRHRDTDGVVNVLAEMLQEARRATGGASYSTIADQFDVVAVEYQEAKRNPGLRGITTGWDTLNLATNGLVGGDLIVIAGRPSMGKSWLISHMAYSAAEADLKVAFCSMEMSLKQIARRWLGMKTGINPNFIRAGEIGTYSEERMLDTINDQRNKKHIHLLGGDMAKSVSSVEAMVLEFQPDILFVDAAYLLTPSGRKQGYVSKWESIAEVVQELKKLSIRYDIPVVISVQFNRNQKSKSKNPLDLSDIAGTDSIPQDASIVMGVRSGPSPNETNQRIIEVMKNREGETPKFATAFSFSPVRMHEVPLIEEGEEGLAMDDDYSSYVL
jgi:replicative DNA helicase